MESGRIYHVYNRGNNRETIFKEPRNYVYFLGLFKRYLGDLIEVHAYCLMPNHFHFLLRIIPYDDEEQNDRSLEKLEKAFKNFFISYAKAINKAYNRTGSLFQVNFKRKLIESAPQYGLNIAYIHFNPVKAGLCHNCSDWVYSSYNSILSKQRTSVEKGAVLEWYGGREEFLSYHELYIKSKLESKLELLF